MSRDEFRSAAFDEELRGMLRAQVDVIAPRGDPMTEIALRGSRRQRHRRALKMTGVAVAVVAAVVAGPALLHSSRNRQLPAHPSPTPSPAVVGLRAPSQGEIEATVALPAADASGAFLAFDHVFVKMRAPSAVVVKVDPATNKVVGSVSFPAALNEGIPPVAASGALWWPGPEAVYRMDPEAMAITSTIPVQVLEAAVASDGDRVWVISAEDTVSQIDTATNRLTRSARVDMGPALRHSGMLKYVQGTLWVAADAAVVQIDPDDMSVGRSIALSGRARSMLAVGETLWISLPEHDQLVRLAVDGIVGEPLQLPPGRDNVLNMVNLNSADPLLAASSDGTTVWSMTNRNELVAVDVASGRVVDHIKVHDTAFHSQVAVDGQTVWVPVRQRAEVLRFRWQPPRR